MQHIVLLVAGVWECNSWQRKNINVPTVIHDDLACSSIKGRLPRKLCHSTSDGSHRPNTHKLCSASHALRYLRCIGKQLKRFERLAKIRMAIDIFFQYPSLTHNFGGDGIELLATDAKGRPSISKTPVGSFPAHELMSNGKAQTFQKAEARAPNGQTRMHARHSIQSASL